MIRCYDRPNLNQLAQLFQSLRAWVDTLTAKWTWCARSADGSKVVCTVCTQFNNGTEFLLDHKHDNLQKHEFGQPGASQWAKELAARRVNVAASAAVVKGAVATIFARVISIASRAGWERDTTVARLAVEAARQARRDANAAVKADVAVIAASKKLVIQAAVSSGHLSLHQKNVRELAAAATATATTTVPQADLSIRDHLSQALQWEFANKKDQLILLYHHMRRAQPFVAYEQLKEPLAMILPTMAAAHWSDNSAVQFAAACNTVVVDSMRHAGGCAECRVLLCEHGRSHGQCDPAVLEATDLRHGSRLGATELLCADAKAGRLGQCRQSDCSCDSTADDGGGHECGRHT